ncbi:sulfate transporter [Acrasis kona]|uniref:Sulfate transporter n=1 Tax=Acrasis kona TaxID=1008807 RepID=A0AAW2ZLK3_9EUKA
MSSNDDARELDTDSHRSFSDSEEYQTNQNTNIVIQDTYFDTIEPDSENVYEFEELFHFYQELRALLFHKMPISMTRSLSNFDFGDTQGSFAKSPSTERLDSISGTESESSSLLRPPPKAPQGRVRSIFRDVRNKFLSVDKNSAATELMQRTSDKLSTTRAEHLQNFYGKLISVLKEQTSKARDHLERMQLFRRARNQLYRQYLVEYHGMNSHSVAEFDKFAELFTDDLAAELEIKNEDECSISLPTSPFQSPHAEHTETTHLLSAANYNANIEELLNKGGNEVQIVKDRIPWWRRLVHVLSFIFPILVWLPEYCQKSEIINNVKRDVLAGTTIAIVLCPQGIAYAMVAGMPPIYGLYTAFIPRTSRVLAVGPSVIISLILYQTIYTDLEVRNSLEYQNYVLLVSMFAGGIQLLCGVLRLGFVMNFLSKPILSGFTTAAAILIAMTQVKYLFGVTPDSEVKAQLYWSLYYLGKAMHDQGIHNVYWKGKKHHIDDFFPSNLIVIVGGTLIMTLISLSPASLAQSGDHDVLGINILGRLDGSLPVPSLPKFYQDYVYVNETPINSTLLSSPHVHGYWMPVGDPIFTWEIARNALLVALPCLFIGFAEAYSVGSYYAIKDNYSVDPNNELMAIGLSAFVGSFFSAYMASTSLSRSALSAAAGARSQLAGLLTGVLMILMLLFVSKLFYYLPKPLLGAMIIMAITKLIDYEMVIYTFKTKKKDFVSWMACFLCTLFVGLQYGILLATLLSLAFVLYRSSRPRLVLLGKEPGTTTYQSIKRFPDSFRTPGVLVVRLDSELFFANCSYVAKYLNKIIDQTNNEVIFNGDISMNNKCRALITDMGSVNQIDSTGVLSLRDIKKILDYRNVKWYIANIKPEVIREMQQGSFIHDDVMDESRLFTTVHDAVRHAVDEIKKKK